MIEKFNFYDIYGYFLPGLALLGVLWLPFMLVHPAWPPSEWASAIAALALAYVLGHFLQGFATYALPSDLAAGKRSPSAALLDPESELPRPVRIRIAEIVFIRFGLDLRVNEEGKAGSEIDRDRNNAFNLARLVLGKERLVTFPDQFEGMYALSRGLAVGLGLGFPYLLGWSFANRAMPCGASLCSGILAGLCLLVSSGYSGWARLKLKKGTRSTLEKISLLSMGLALFLAGYLLEQRYNPCHAKSSIFIIVAVAMLIAGIRFYNAYTFFAVHFAKTVWREFLAFNSYHQNGDSPTAAHEEHAI